MIKDSNTEFNINEQLIYDILFSKKKVFLIKLDDFCIFEERTKFKTHIRKICKKGKVKILDDRIIHADEYVCWKLEIKK